MDPRVLEECHAILDRYVTEPELRSLLGTFIGEKQTEGTLWSKITIQTHFMLGGDSPDIYRHAALTELVMLAYDIVDDLQDRDNPAKPWMTCPTEYTLNGVLAFLVACIGELSPSAAPDAARFLALSVNGQQADLSGNVHSEQDYLEMVALKSGALIRFACMMGYSLVPGLMAEEIRRLDELAAIIGIIAQLSNDIRDITLIGAKSDLLLRKRTLPILFLLEHAAEDCTPLADYYSGRISRDEFVEHHAAILDFITHSGCLEYSRVIQALHIDQAEDLYSRLNAVSPWKEAFRNTTYAPQDQQS